MYEIFDFDPSIEKCINFLQKLQPIVNADLCEDVSGGLQHGLKQKWEATTRYAILIADYPGHGSQYHNTQENDYQD